ncbi:unnamed protein product [Chrysodeixis includens]|uniref:Uncharacterized protein n=1 Tax=Chrysodeixis includens TaxID=689277 RepID=A0A9N8L558_CHRIL|nr:unnamed protein product [Chrysodeixis includens]
MSDVETKTHQGIRASFDSALVDFGSRALICDVNLRGNVVAGGIESSVPCSATLGNKLALREGGNWRFIEELEGKGFRDRWTASGHAAADDRRPDCFQCYEKCRQWKQSDNPTSDTEGETSRPDKKSSQYELVTDSGPFTKRLRKAYVFYTHDLTFILGESARLLPIDLNDNRLLGSHNRINITGGPPSSESPVEEKPSSETSYVVGAWPQSTTGHTGYLTVATLPPVFARSKLYCCFRLVLVDTCAHTIFCILLYVTKNHATTTTLNGNANSLREIQSSLLITGGVDQALSEFLIQSSCTQPSCPKRLNVVIARKGFRSSSSSAGHTQLLAHVHIAIFSDIQRQIETPRRSRILWLEDAVGSILAANAKFFRPNLFLPRQS